MDPERLVDLLTRTSDNRNPGDMMRWREAQTDALIEALRQRLNRPGGK